MPDMEKIMPGDFGPRELGTGKFAATGILLSADWKSMTPMRALPSS